LRVLALATYPEHAAATRQRVIQYVPLLAEHGIELDVRPFLTNRIYHGLYDVRKAPITAAGVAAGIVRRGGDVLRLGSYDALFLQREAALVGPPVVEWLAQRRMPLVLDLDDATYIDRPSDVFGSLAARLKWRGKTRQLIRWSSHVVCGSPAIAAYAAERGKPVTILPTLVDVNRYRPRQHSADGELVIGWIGTHSTYAYLRTLAPVFRRLAQTHRFRLRVIGAGPAASPIDGVALESRPWRMESEVADLQSFDVAVYPIVADEWAEGKSGYKAIQYLACGIPYVASPVGVVAGIGVPGVTHLEATTEEDWVAALSRLLSDARAREEMSRQGRAYAVAHYSTRDGAATLAGIFHEVARKKNSRP
jgi:glycosyltransferase involved in cell wall biosynthesis